ncbi:hypothetical protein SAMN05421678_103392 [Actinopolymorpha cephalotaxi]|uniref:Uncharacterized protein n=1 Tax=Actinopolymorpha cephalotaxi TaxID=504797 RepID=A0A1I2NIM9_9ACTN|nr:hypothetical protein [Actinopolymorpha cephalotaxi]NYH85500.1 hypothetical protein [Actinopolymorpha cephalotaxi]SFG03458.1 hypothetical protein SAMN05421678_103392 [Actinopolymorpha cephalotaxi]
MFIGSPEFPTLRQLPHLGTTSLATSRRVPTPSQGSLAADLQASATAGRMGHRFRRFTRRPR